MRNWFVVHMHAYEWFRKGSYQLYASHGSCLLLQVGGLRPRITKLAFGAVHGMALRQDERAYHWGTDMAGSLGLGPYAAAAARRQAQYAVQTAHDAAAAAGGADWRRGGDDALVMPEPGLFKYWLDDVAVGLAHSVGERRECSAWTHSSEYCCSCWARLLGIAFILITCVEYGWDEEQWAVCLQGPEQAGAEQKCKCGGVKLMMCSAPPTPCCTGTGTCPECMCIYAGCRRDS